jgi:TolA-binding protein
VRFLPAAALLILALPAPLAAQAVDVAKLDRRVEKLESEVRAVQRKVFPGGDSRFFAPETPAQAPPPAPTPDANPASTPLVDLTARVESLESTLKGMTGQIEAMEFKLRALEDAQRRMKGDVEFRLNALEKPAGPDPVAEPAALIATPGAAVAGAATVPPPGAVRPASAAKPAAAKPATAPATPAATAAALPAATPTAAWAAAYPKVTARDWPGVETAMTQFIADWPKSPRVAQAKYWLGRSFAARGQQAEAAKTFLDLYKTAPQTAPAPDALIGLAGALNAMAKPANACQVLTELTAVYGAKLTDTQKADAGRQRARAKCIA